MFYPASLEFRNYIPDELKQGMLFQGITWDKLPVIYELKHHVSDEDKETYISLNGYPVEPYIVSIPNENLNDEITLAIPDEIAWVDEGDDSDELHDITIDEINTILQKYDGKLLIEMEELPETDELQTTLYDGKVTIRFFEENE